MPINSNLQPFGLTVAREPIPTVLHDYPWSARKPEFTGRSSTFHLRSISTQCPQESPVFSPVLIHHHSGLRGRRMGSVFATGIEGFHPGCETIVSAS